MKRLLEELLPRPEHALAPGTALRDDLVPLRRVKFGRHRLVFVASREKRLAIVLLIGFRKDGDKHDVYEDVRRRARRGEFDSALAELGAASMGRR
jgi:tRNA1(Val) A37 N6-methylase TrmN6